MGHGASFAVRMPLAESDAALIGPPAITDGPSATSALLAADCAFWWLKTTPTPRTCYRCY